jgi:phage-related protein
LQLIEELDLLPRPNFKRLVEREGIWEVRIQFGNDIFRLLGFFDDGKLILTNGFSKKTPEMPPQDIALAVRRKEGYFVRRNKP